VSPSRTPTPKPASIDHKLATAPFDRSLQENHAFAPGREIERSDLTELANLRRRWWRVLGLRYAAEAQERRYNASCYRCTGLHVSNRFSSNFAALNSSEYGAQICIAAFRSRLPSVALPCTTCHSPT